MKATLSTKDYPLIIEATVDETGSVDSYYAKGHAHTSSNFIEAVLAVVPAPEDDGPPPLRADEIEYHWYRERPLLPAEREQCDFGHSIGFAKPGTPGAFPVMVMHLD